MSVKPIPDGYHNVTPYIVVQGAGQAIEFYRKAFGAEVLYKLDGPGGSVMHAEIRVGDSPIMLSDANPDWGAVAPDPSKGVSSSLMIYTEDADAAYKKAVAAGAQSLQEPEDMFWGDRMAKVQDPFGHQWSLGTHKEDVSPEEIGKRAAAMFSQG